MSSWIPLHIAMTGTHLCYKIVKLRSWVGLRSLPLNYFTLRVMLPWKRLLGLLGLLGSLSRSAPRCQHRLSSAGTSRASCRLKRQTNKCNVICKLSAACAYTSCITHVMISSTILDRSCLVLRNCEHVWRHCKTDAQLFPSQSLLHSPCCLCFWNCIDVFRVHLKVGGHRTQCPAVAWIQLQSWISIINFNWKRFEQSIGAWTGTSTGRHQKRCLKHV